MGLSERDEQDRYEGKALGELFPEGAPSCPRCLVDLSDRDRDEPSCPYCGKDLRKGADD